MMYSTGVTQYITQNVRNYRFYRRNNIEDNKLWYIKTQELYNPLLTVRICRLWYTSFKRKWKSRRKIFFFLIRFILRHPVEMETISQSSLTS